MPEAHPTETPKQQSPHSEGADQGRTPDAVTSMKQDASPPTPMTFCALEHRADAESANVQRWYLGLLRTELVGLLGAVAMPIGILVWPNVSRTPYIAIGSAAFILLALVSSFASRTLHLQARWYSARALSESLKSESWRYVMHTDGYVGSGASTRLAETVRELMTAHIVKPTLKRMGVTAIGDVITAEMQCFREYHFSRRRALYDVLRLGDQWKWYKKGMMTNRRAEAIWFGVGICAQLAAFGCAIWAIAASGSIAIVSLAATAATSAIAWTTAKDFGFHAQSYGNIASELRLLAEDSKTVKTEADLVKHVDDVENLVSREHTIWVARRK